MTAGTHSSSDMRNFESGRGTGFLLKQILLKYTWSVGIYHGYVSVRRRLETELNDVTNGH